MCYKFRHINLKSFHILPVHLSGPPSLACSLVTRLFSEPAASCNRQTQALHTYTNPDSRFFHTHALCYYF